MFLFQISLQWSLSFHFLCSKASVCHPGGSRVRCPSVSLPTQSLGQEPRHIRPIGIGDTIRRIIAKAVISVLKDEVLDAAASMQLCVGQMAGVESTIHAARKKFDSPETEAVLLVDTSNGFNSLNRKAALHNIRSVCPSIFTILINTYREASQLFIDGDVIYSEEGTTLGDPLAM